MKFSADLKAVSQAVSVATALFSRGRQFLPGGGNGTVLIFRAEENRVCLKTRNLMEDVTIQIPAYVEVQGEAAVPVKQLDALSRGSSGMVTFEANGSYVLARFGSTVLKLPKVDPVLPEFGKEKREGPEDAIAVEVSRLSTVVKQLSRICGPSQKDRPYEGTLLIAPHRFGGTAIVATNGYALAYRRISPETVSGRYVLTCREVLGILRGLKTLRKENVRVELSDPMVSFSAEGVTYLLRIEDASYPDVSHLVNVPNEADEIVVPAEELGRVLNLARSLEVETVAFRIKPEGPLSAEGTAEGGNLGCEIPLVEQKVKEEVRIGFTPELLDLGLQALPEGTVLVRLMIQGPKEPCVLLPAEANPERAADLVLVMPRVLDA